MIYALAAREFARKDEEIILSKLKEYAVVYQAGGPDAGNAPNAIAAIEQQLATLAG